jgi:hypothetical protein
MSGSAFRGLLLATPVGGKALYSRSGSGDAITMAGQNAYLSFDRIVRLTEATWQRGRSDEPCYSGLL